MYVGNGNGGVLASKERASNLLHAGEGAELDEQPAVELDGASALSSERLPLGDLLQHGFRCDWAADFLVENFHCVYRRWGKDRSSSDKTISIVAI